MALVRASIVASLVAGCPSSMHSGNGGMPWDASCGDRPALAYMEAGDSITEGYESPGVIGSGYRGPLQSSLVGAGWTPVGPYENGGLRHAGAGGRRIAGVTAALPTLISVYRPRAIVLMIGVNDAIQPGYVGATASAEYSTLLATLASLDPLIAVVVVVGLPIVAGAYAGFAANVADLSSRIDAAVDACALEAAGRIVRADLSGTLTAAELPDGLHPSPAGYALLAEDLRAPVLAAMAIARETR